MLRSLVVIAAFWAATANAGPLPEAQRDLFLSFARDVSGDDPSTMEVADRLVTHPPRTLEEIGFYSMETAPDAERSLFGIIGLLDDNGFLVSVEDKYVYELTYLLQERGFIQAVEQDRKLDVQMFFEGFDWDQGTEPDWAAFKLFFPEHVQAIEKAVEGNGMTILEVRMPFGDTLFYWLVSSDVATRWRDRTLYFGVNRMRFSQEMFTRVYITDPDWTRYWLFMTYALNIPEAHEAPPDGL